MVGPQKRAMKTLRIDQMLSGSGARTSTVKMANCPVCAVTVKREDMNRHLDSCLVEAMFTQPSNPAPPQQTNRPRREPVPLPDDTTCPAPVTSTSALNPPTNTHKTYDVMQYIAHPAALYNLALSPNNFSLEQVDKIFKHLPPYLPQPSQPIRQDPIKHFLQSLIHPQSPSSREQQAKAILNPLAIDPGGEEFSFQAVSERLSMTWSDVLQLIRKNSSTDKHGNIVFSPQLIDMLSSSRPPNATRHTSDTPLKRPRSTKTLVEENVNQLNHSRKRTSDLISPGSRHKIQTEGDGRQREVCRNPKRPAHMKICPICNNDIGQSGLEEHISICVAASQGQDADDTEQNPPGVLKKVQPCPTPASRPGSRISEKTSDKNQRCPICDVALSRQVLEAHVASCMMSTGLADAF